MKLCLTTRETLYHYEKMGLLRPTVDETNGYRYYTPYDYYTFMYITHLTKIGFTLNEVHQFLENQTLDSYFTAIEISENRLLERINNLKLRNIRTKRGYELIQHVLNKPLNKPQITYRDAEYYLKVPFDHENPIISDVECSCEHDKYVLENNLDIQRHFHGFYSEHPFDTPQPVFDYSLSMLTGYVECDRLFIQPEGMYISMCFRGPFHHDTSIAYEMIRNYLDKHRYEPLSGMFVYAATSPFYTKDINEYIAELSIRIE